MLKWTLILALLFMFFQGIEYFISPVSIDTGIYGSTFYMITGLHGFHVFLGTCFLFYCKCAVLINKNFTFFINLYEIIFNNFLKNINLFGINKNVPTNISLLSNYSACSTWFYGKHGIESFECAAWYWHFVDVVWIFVFAFVYVWSHLTVLDKM
jgi:cytochrome c oxidase subunit 3